MTADNLTTRQETQTDLYKITSKSILVVDDNTNNLKLVRHLLDEEGYMVRLATGGQMALTSVKSNQPDLILLDITMPEMDGYAVCEVLKKTPETCRIPIIFLSALKESVDVVKGFTIGGVDFITKPFSSGILLARIKTQLTINHLQNELRSTNENLKKHITERKQVEIELKQHRNHLQELVDERTIDLEKAVIEAEGANRMKSEFLANMSHELRTPLNGLLILAECLRDNDEGNLTAEQLKDMENIYDAGKDLLRLINDILDLSKVEAGKMEIHSEVIVINEFATNLRAKFAPLAEKKGLFFTVDVAPDVPEILHSDPQRLKQILGNFLSNAFKFTHEGGVTVRVLTEGNQIGLAISDTGIGIPEEQQDTVFSAFHQADGSTSRKYGGTGLGLSISREFAKLLGGHITLQSVKGKGSLFTLYLPQNTMTQGI